MGTLQQEKRQLYNNNYYYDHVLPSLHSQLNALQAMRHLVLCYKFHAGKILIHVNTSYYQSCQSPVITNEAKSNEIFLLIVFFAFSIYEHF